MSTLYCTLLSTKSLKCLYKHKLLVYCYLSVKNFLKFGKRVIGSSHLYCECNWNTCIHCIQIWSTNKILNEIVKLLQGLYYFYCSSNKVLISTYKYTHKPNVFRLCAILRQQSQSANNFNSSQANIICTSIYILIGSKVGTTLKMYIVEQRAIQTKNINLYQVHVHSTYLNLFAIRQ